MPVRTPFRLQITSRQALGGLIPLLVLGLVAALIALWLLLRGTGLPALDETPHAGIRPLLVLTGPGTGAKPHFDKPMGVAFGAEDRIYVADTGNDRVCVFDRRGRFLFEFGGSGLVKPQSGSQPSWKPGLMSFPTDIAVDDQGNVYVADFGNDQVQVFGRDGKFVRAFPDPNEPTGRGSAGQGGRGIAVTAVDVRGGFVYATDRSQIFVFTTRGRLVRQFGRPGVGPDGLDHPNGLAVAEDGTVYVSDSNHHRVAAFSSRGKPLWRVGKPPVTAMSIDVTPSDEPSETPGSFGLPRGIALYGDDIICTDAFNFQLVQISRSGDEIARFGERGSAAGQMSFPNGVDARNTRVVVADKENGRVMMVQLVGK